MRNCVLPIKVKLPDFLTRPTDILGMQPDIQPSGRNHSPPFTGNMKVNIYLSHYTHSGKKSYVFGGLNFGGLRG